MQQYLQAAMLLGTTLGQDGDPRIEAVTNCLSSGVCTYSEDEGSLRLVYVVTAARLVSPAETSKVSWQDEAAALSHYTDKKQEQRDSSNKSIFFILCDLKC